MNPHFPTKQETAVCHLKGEIKMGNDLVGQAIDVMKKYRPEKTVIKIWNKGKSCLILAAKNPKEYQMEMDPYYVFAEGAISGISYLDNADKLKKIMKPECLAYVNKSIDIE